MGSQLKENRVLSWNSFSLCMELLLRLVEEWKTPVSIALYIAVSVLSLSALLFIKVVTKPYSIYTS